MAFKSALFIAKAEASSYLDLENPDHICFHNRCPIEDKNLSIDHVIPWSYLFSDDLWNLVYVDKSNNSEKGNRIPSQKTIKRLVDRNKDLMKLVEPKYPKDKQTEELKLSIERDLVQKSWVGCKG